LILTFLQILYLNKCSFYCLLSGGQAFLIVVLFFLARISRITLFFDRIFRIYYFPECKSGGRRIDPSGLPPLSRIACDPIKATNESLSLRSRSVSFICSILYQLTRIPLFFISAKKRGGSFKISLSEKG